jgi:homocysteine S-methyltransferase
VATAASYQASFPAFTRRGRARHEAQALMQLSVELAMEARDTAGGGVVAASVGPYGAALANGAEYTGDYDLDERELREWHRPRGEVLAGSGADVLACETIPSYAEARVIARLLDETPHVNAWVGFSCRDDERIRDGTPLSRCAELFAGNPQVVAVGVNCTSPAHIKSLIGHLNSSPIIVYPNSGETWDAEHRRWRGIADPLEFATAAADWRDAGAPYIGGCCRTTPEHIRLIRERLG